MPHVSEVRATSPDHDRHDLMLVAALAAGDLSGTDRDHALDLTRSCASCAELHDDLVAIARASASAPPPIATRPRDFLLTPEDAARLRPAGWRRVLAGLGGAPRAVTRPLGAGLATIGLVGLLIGNTPAFSLGGSAASPAGRSSVTGSSQQEDAHLPAAVPAASGVPQGAYPVPVASSAAASAAASPADNLFGTNGQASPSAVRAQGGANDPGASSSERVETGPLTASGTDKAAATPGSGLAGLSEPPQATESPFRPTNLLFGGAVLAGLGVLILGRRRGREAR